MKIIVHLLFSIEKNKSEVMFFLGRDQKLPPLGMCKNCSNNGGNFWSHPILIHFYSNTCLISKCQSCLCSNMRNIVRGGERERGGRKKRKREKERERENERK